MSGASDGERAVPSGGPGYRRRVYASYVSRFKGAPEPSADAAHLARAARVYDHLLRDFLAGPRPARLLEVGCGSGALLHWARERGFPGVEGVDVSAEQVALARSRGLPVTEARAEEFLAAHRERWDAVVALDLVEHFTRDEALAFLDACRGALGAGGRLVLTTPNGAGWRPGPVALGDLTHETIFTPASIRLALELAGFASVRVAEVRPPPVSARARVRRALWGVMRLLPAIVDLVETGGTGAGVYSRVMLVTARRPG